MLRKALIFLPVFFSFFTSKSTCQVNDSDTVKKVYINITLVQQPGFFDSTSKSKNGKKSSKALNLNPPYSKIQTIIKNNKSEQKINPIQADSNIRIPKKERYTQLRKQISKQSNSQNSMSNASVSKYNYFLTSLIFIITGTLLAAFFRSGFPLILAILLLLAGYYILSYSLLFME